MTGRYILDACALLAAYKQEDGFSVVADLYEDAVNGDTMLSMNMINLFEVYYGLIYEFGIEFANERLREVTESIVEITDLTIPKLIEAGRLKTTYQISLADAIAIAEAIISKGTLITADHHEMDRVEQSEQNIQFLWIR